MNKMITLKLDTKEIDRVSIGGMLFDALDYENVNNVYGFKEDKECRTIQISKKDIIKLIKLVNRDSMFNDFCIFEIVD